MRLGKVGVKPDRLAIGDGRLGVPPLLEEDRAELGVRRRDAGRLRERLAQVGFGLGGIGAAGAGRGPAPPESRASPGRGLQGRTERALRLARSGRAPRTPGPDRESRWNSSMAGAAILPRRRDRQAKAARPVRVSPASRAQASLAGWAIEDRRQHVVEIAEVERLGDVGEGSRGERLGGQRDLLVWR